MQRDGESVAVDVASLYEYADSDISFSEVLSSAVVKDDDHLAELIESDGRARIERSRPIDLERYLAAVSDLEKRPVALDAAVDVVLRALSGSARASQEAIDELSKQYPQFADVIREAAMLNAAVWSTRGLRSQLDQVPTKPVPSDFGPLLPSGERRYVLQQMIGEGAFAQVYRALDRHLSEEGHTAEVAIKILTGVGRSEADRQRLIEEATKVRRISHSNVVLVIDRGVTDQDEDYIVYEYVDGGDLDQSCSKQLPMPPDDATRLMTGIARGLHAAHSAGVIHCDLKPGNVMLTSRGVPKIADFGIAMREGDVRQKMEAVERAGHGPIGNIAFISPEQYRGEHGAFSVQSDVYALGGMLYWLLTGRLPNGSSIKETDEIHDPQTGRTEAPRIRPSSSSVDHDLEAICRRAMAPKPEDRYQSAAALAEDLERYRRREPIRWTRPGFFRVTKLWAKRKPPLAIAATLIVLLLITGSVVAWTSVVNGMKLREEQRRTEATRRVAGSILTKITELRNEETVDTQLLGTIWLMEYVYGPTVLDISGLNDSIWNRRIEVIRRLVNAAHDEGRTHDLDTLLWESALAFWLVFADDFEESIPLLRSNSDKWSSILNPNDPWLDDLRSIESCAQVNRLAAQELTADDIGHAHKLVARLSATSKELAGRSPGSPLHFLVLRSLTILHGPEILDQPEVRRSYEDEYEQVLHPSR